MWDFLGQVGSAPDSMGSGAGMGSYSMSGGGQSSSIPGSYLGAGLAIVALVVVAVMVRR